MIQDIITFVALAAIAALVCYILALKKRHKEQIEVALQDEGDAWVRVDELANKNYHLEEELDHCERRLEAVEIDRNFTIAEKDNALRLLELATSETPYQLVKDGLFRGQSTV